MLWMKLLLPLLDYFFFRIFNYDAMGCKVNP